MDAALTIGLAEPSTQKSRQDDAHRPELMWTFTQAYRPLVCSVRAEKVTAAGGALTNHYPMP